MKLKQDRDIGLPVQVIEANYHLNPSDICYVRNQFICEFRRTFGRSQ